MSLSFIQSSWPGLLTGIAGLLTAGATWYRYRHDARIKSNDSLVNEAIALTNTLREEIERLQADNRVLRRQIREVQIELEDLRDTNAILSRQLMRARSRMDQMDLIGLGHDEEGLPQTPATGAAQ